MVKYSDLQPGYLSEAPKALPAKERIPVVKEKPQRHKKPPAKTVLARQKPPKKQAKAKTRRIKDRVPVVAKLGTPIVFSAEPTARELVYKHYVQWQKSRETIPTMERIEQYQGYIDQYSAEVGLDAELTRGLIAVESKGRARAISPVKAKGLGQIYSVPSICHRRAEEILGVDRVNVWDPRQNIVLSLVTLHYYTSIKNNNLLLGLVSYNCGPGHRKLKGVHSYEELRIKKGIKRYPIDVLALTLVAKVRKQYGEILPYNEENRAKIESIYLPGLGM
jgi:soluble lytic murein transglycosylase-like protein